MAEAVGVASAVIAIIDLAATITVRCKSYITHVKDARKELRGILAETTSLQGIADNIRFLLNDDPDFENAGLDAAREPISACLESLKRLESLVPALGAHGDEGRTASERATNLALRLAWPLKRNRVISILKDMQPHKANLSLIMCGEILQDVKTIKAEVSKVHKLLTDSERMSFLNWLCTVNPSGNHNLATARHEKGTVSWLLRHPDWLGWATFHNRGSRCVWIHGIPGSGKTVLTAYSYLQVDSVRKTGSFASKNHYDEPCRDSQPGLHQNLSIACVYYYCHYTRNQDETPHFLRWVVNQLCQQSNVVPTGLLELYRQQCDPSVDHLVSALKSCLDAFDVVYIVLDAVDESKDRENLLELLETLATDTSCAKIRLLASSREYSDIITAMSKVSTPITMSNPYIEGDIRTHVEAIVERQRKTTYRHLSDEFLRHVCDVLPSKANGMFQWAVSQLDTIRRLRWNDEAHLRKALNDLPKDLYTTYERIFTIIQDTSSDDGQFVRDALTWISYNNALDNGRKMHLCALLSAIYPTDCFVSTRTVLAKRLGHLLELLGCLVHVEDCEFLEIEHDEENVECNTDDCRKLGCISLSHYTISEFLNSDHIRTSLAAAFAPWEWPRFFESVMHHALHVDSDPHAITLHECGISLFALRTVTLSIKVWGDRIANFPELAQLVAKFFKIDAPHWMKAIGFSKDECCDLILETLEGRLAWYFWLCRPSPTSRITSTTAAIFTLTCLLAMNQWGLAKALVSAHSNRQGSSALRDIFLTPICWDIGIAAFRTCTTGHSDEVVQYAFEGTLPEWAATLAAVDGCSSPQSDGILDFLYRNYSSIVQQSRGILLPISAHHGRVGLANQSLVDCFEHQNCIFTRLVNDGANIEASGYQTTPLQIAVMLDDFRAVRSLLAAGADVNNTGTVGGIDFATKTFLSRFNALHGASPLYICRKQQTRFKEDGPWYWDGHHVEELLLKHGAKEFRSSMADHTKDCEVDDENFERCFFRD